MWIPTFTQWPAVNGTNSSSQTASMPMAQMPSTLSSMRTRGRRRTLAWARWSTSTSTWCTARYSSTSSTNRKGTCKWAFLLPLGFIQHSNFDRVWLNMVCFCAIVQFTSALEASWWASREKWRVSRTWRSTRVSTYSWARFERSGEMWELLQSEPRIKDSRCTLVSWNADN